MKPNNIQYIKVTKEARKIYPGLKSRRYKEVWCLRNSDENEQQGLIVGAITKDDDFLTISPYYEKEIAKFNRKMKLNRIIASQ